MQFGVKKKLVMTDFMNVTLLSVGRIDLGARRTEREAGTLLGDLSKSVERKKGV